MKVKLKIADNGKEPFETLPVGTIVEVEGGNLWMKVQDYQEKQTCPSSNNRRAVGIGPRDTGLRGIINGKDYKRVVQGTFVED